MKVATLNTSLFTFLFTFIFVNTISCKDKLNTNGKGVESIYGTDSSIYITALRSFNEPFKKEKCALRLCILPDNNKINERGVYIDFVEINKTKLEVSIKQKTNVSLFDTSIVKIEKFTIKPFGQTLLDSLALIVVEDGIDCKYCPLIFSGIIVFGETTTKNGKHFFKRAIVGTQVYEKLDTGSQNDVIKTELFVGNILRRLIYDHPSLIGILPTNLTQNSKYEIY